MAWSIASVTMLELLNPELHADAKYLLANLMYWRLKICFFSLSSLSQISAEVIIFRMSVARLKFPGWMMLTCKEEAKVGPEYKCCIYLNNQENEELGGQGVGGDPGGQG